MVDHPAEQRENRAGKTENNEEETRTKQGFICGVVLGETMVMNIRKEKCLNNREEDQLLKMRVSFVFSSRAPMPLPWKRRLDRNSFPLMNTTSDWLM